MHSAELYLPNKENGSKELPRFGDKDVLRNRNELFQFK